MIEKNDQGIYSRKLSAKKEAERKLKIELRKKYKDQDLNNLTNADKDELLFFMAGQLGLLKEEK